MDIKDAVPPGAGPLLTPCPRCERDDRVMAVPAVYAASQSSEEVVARASAVLHDDDAMLSRRREARATIAATPAPLVPSKQLAPAPRAYTSTYASLAAFLTAPTVGLWIAYSMSRSTDPQPSVLAPNDQGFSVGFSTTDLGSTGIGDTGLSTVVGHNSTLMYGAIAATVVAATCLLVTLVSVVRRLVIRKGRPAADAVWRHGWYCGRCATVYFRAGEAPTGIAPATAIPPADFQHAVWTAGGYARKAPARIS
jgi:hypothetical protein